MYCRGIDRRWPSDRAADQGVIEGCGIASSFQHENSSGKFICTNDQDAKGTIDQIIYRARVRSADRLLFKPKDRVDFAAAPLTAGSNGLSGAVSGLSVHFTAGSSQVMHWR